MKTNSNQMVTIQVPEGSLVIPPKRLKEIKTVFKSQLALWRASVIKTPTETIGVLEQKGFTDEELVDSLFLIINHIPYEG